MEDNCWGVQSQPRAWAEEVEEAEQQNGGSLPHVNEEAFPSLSAAATKPAPKGKKKQQEKLSLGAFLAGGAAGGGARSGARAPADDSSLLLNLPKGSSGKRDDDREAGALGGAFNNYGGQREGYRNRREDREDFERPVSKADTASDWGAERKFVPSDGPSRGGGFGGGFGGGRDRGEDRRGFEERPPRREYQPSAADEVDNWGSNRKFVPSTDEDRRGGGGFGGGFRDRDGPKEGGFRERDGPREGGFRERPRYDEPSRADAGDWGSRRAPPGPEPGAAEGASGRTKGYGFSGEPTAADGEDRWVRRGPPGEPSGAAAASSRPSERPRLNLKPRSKPVEDDKAPASGAATPESEEAAAAGSSGRSPQVTPTKAPRSNPFGAARPREEVLKEKGRDYVKEELKLEHGEVIRDKTPEETALEGEVEALRVKLEGLKELEPGETDTLEQLAKELDDKEKALYRMQAELDDEVKYSKNKPNREEERVRPPPVDDRDFEVARGGRRAGRGPRDEQPESGRSGSRDREVGGFRDRREGPPRDRDGLRGGRGGPDRPRAW